MNMLFIADASRDIIISRTDRRYEHIVKILKKVPGDEIFAGSADGFLGNARILSITENEIRLNFQPLKIAEQLHQIRLILGFPRPIQANRILKDITSLGVADIWLTLTELTEKSYVKSDIFAHREYTAALIEGAEQAGNPRLPKVSTFWSLKRALDTLSPQKAPATAETRLALHLDAGAVPLSDIPLAGNPVILAIGSERGWTEQEVDLLCNYGFTICTMGKRILKTETATIAAVSIILSKLNLL